MGSAPSAKSDHYKSKRLLVSDHGQQFPQASQSQPQVQVRCPIHPNIQAPHSDRSCLRGCFHRACLPNTLERSWGRIQWLIQCFHHESVDGSLAYAFAYGLAGVVEPYTPPLTCFVHQGQDRSPRRSHIPHVGSFRRSDRRFRPQTSVDILCRRQMAP